VVAGLPARAGDDLETLATGELIGCWMLAPTEGEPVKGKHFHFKQQNNYKVD
jgi:hypothetical protein